MERLKETDEEVDNDVGVKYPGKGKDYVVLPASDKGDKAADGGSGKKKKLLFIAGLCFIILVIIVIVLCVVFLSKKSGADDSADYPDTSSKLTCTLAGISPSEAECKSKGCDYFEKVKFSESSRCVYPDITTYMVDAKSDTNGSLGRGVELMIQQEKHNKSVIVSIVETVDSSIRIKIGNTESEDRPTLPEDHVSTLLIKTSEVGEPFSFSITSNVSGDVIFDTNNLTMVFTEGLVELNGVLTTDKVHNGGKWLKIADEPSIPVWHSADSLNLPYFYGKNPEGGYFGIAMTNTYPTRIMFGKRGTGNNVVGFSMLGGFIDMYIFAGPTLSHVTQQVITSFGGTYRPPYWTLGSIAVNDIEKPLTAEQYPLDAIIQLEAIYSVSDSQTIKHHIHTVDPTRADYDIESGDPLVMTAGGKEPFRGNPEEVSNAPGSAKAYVDYTAEMEKYHYTENSIYMSNCSGYNLILNYPTNYINKCEDNAVNNPPYFKLSEKELYSGTLCLDYLHIGGTHNKIHNIYGHLQAQVLSSFAEDRGEPILQFSESVFLGSGKVTAKTLTVSDWKSLQQVISKSIWYGKVGINVVTLLDQEVTDPDLILTYHRLIPYLPFTTAQEKALSLKNQFTDILEYTLTKYEFYPEWITALYNMEANKQPLIRCVSYNFPKDSFMATSEYADYNQYMIGEKILIAPVVTKVNEAKAYLPKIAVWYQNKEHEDGQFGFKKVSGGKQIIAKPGPQAYFYVKGGSIMITSQRYTAHNIKFGREFIERSKYRKMNIHVLPGDSKASIAAKYMLTDVSDVTLDVTYSRVNATDTLVMDVSNKENNAILWGTLILYEIEHPVDGITVNGHDYDASYNYDGFKRILSIYGATNGSPLNMKYTVNINYRIE